MFRLAQRICTVQMLLAIAPYRTHGRDRESPAMHIWNPSMSFDARMKAVARWKSVRRICLSLLTKIDFPGCTQSNAHKTPERPTFESSTSRLFNQSACPCITRPHPAPKNKPIQMTKELQKRCAAKKTKGRTEKGSTGRSIKRAQGGISYANQKIIHLPQETKIEKAKPRCFRID